jgi:hypothetical protein
LSEILFDPEKNIGMTERIVGIYVCFQCKEINEIYDYNPKDADNDTRIGYLVEMHLQRHPSLAERVVTEWSRLGFIPEKMWKSAEYRKQITDEILKGNNQKGFDSETYSIMDTLKEDAMKCFQAHGRPVYKAPGCQDFLSASKEIKPKTGVERKAAGLPSYDETKVKRRFLCEHCPYFSDAQSKIRIEKAKR